MLSAHQPPYSRRVANGEHRMSPTPSEQSFQTTVTNPASLFSVSHADAISDSISLATTTGGDSMIWERRPRTVMPVGYTMVRAQPPGFLNFGAPGQLHQQPQQSDIDLFEFLKDAQLEHYYTALTTHLKIRSVQQIKYVEDSDLTELGFSRPEQRRLRKYFKRECPQTTMGKLRKRLSRSAMGRVSSSSSCKPRDQLMDFDSSPFHTNSVHTPTADVESRGMYRGWEEDGAPRTPTRSAGIATNHNESSNNGTSTGKRPVYRMINSDQLEIGTSLGVGEFGRVYQGVWRPDSGGVIQVAVKTLDSHGLINDPSDFLSEIAVMHRINHPDIVHLYGVCMEQDSWKIVTELAPLRSLLECLREPELRPSFPVIVLHRFAVQIARGMSYLEEMGLVHRDLAARNILVFSKEMVKISDFGMSRALRLGKSYYQSNFNVNLKLPTAWCAPECIHDLCFTSASDVWAYAVTLWEMYTYGFTPWAGLTGRQIMETIDAPQSGRLDQPDACPDPMYDAVMRTCWAHEPKARPSFSQLFAMLPRLCPEKWVTTREYHPQPESQNEPGLNESQQCLSYLPSTGIRSLGRHLAVGANELVYVLGKRSSHLWKVVSHYSGQVGCVPTSILKPYSPIACESRDSPADQNLSNQSGGESSLTSAANKALQRNSRRASLSDLAFRKTVSRLTKLTGSGNHNGGGHSVTPNSRGSRLTADKISLPQNDFRHVGHVGSDGRTFGDLGLVGTAMDSGDELRSSQTSVISDTSDPALAGSNPTKSFSGEESRIRDSTDRPTLNGSVDRTVSVDSSATGHNQMESPKVIPSLASHAGDMNKEKNNRAVSNRGGLSVSKTVDTVDVGMDLDFGASLLDEVFKCFSLDTPLSTVSESKVLDGQTLTINKSEQPDSSPVQNGTTDTQIIERVSPKLTSDMQPEVPFKPKYLNLTSRHLEEPSKDINERTSLRMNGTGTLNPSHLQSFSTRLDQNPDLTISTKVSDNPVVSRRSRALSREPLSDEPDVDTGADSSLRSRWKRSSFGSLSRRSSSVSKVSGGDRRREHRMREDSEPPPDGLRSSSRLTISRPVLISKPAFINDLSTDSLTLGRLPSTSSSTLTSLGRNTIDRSSLRSSISRESSLTMVSSSNDYPYSGGASTGEGLDEHMFDTHRDGLFSHTNGASISPASSLSSVSRKLTSAGVTGCSGAALLPGAAGASSTAGGLRALRGGDVIFRATTHTTGGVLGTRRKISGTVTNEAPRPLISRPVTRDFTPTFGTTRSSDYSINPGGSANILSRLDGLSSNSTHGGALNRVGTDQKGGTTRRLSTTSSSSSSSSSSPLSPPSLVNSPVRLTDNTRSSSRLSGINRPSQLSSLGVTSTKHLDENGEISSFWGSTFADLLNGSSTSVNKSDVALDRVSASDLPLTPTNDAFKSTLSSNPRAGLSSRPLASADDDEVVAM